MANKCGRGPGSKFKNPCVVLLSEGELVRGHQTDNLFVVALGHSKMISCFPSNSIS